MSSLTKQEAAQLIYKNFLAEKMAPAVLTKMLQRLGEHGVPFHFCSILDDLMENPTSRKTRLSSLYMHFKIFLDIERSSVEGLAFFCIDPSLDSIEKFKEKHLRVSAVNEDALIKFLDASAVRLKVFHFPSYTL